MYCGKIVCANDEKDIQTQKQLGNPDKRSAEPGVDD